MTKCSIQVRAAGIVGLLYCPTVQNDAPSRLPDVQPAIDILHIEHYLLLNCGLEFDRYAPPRDLYLQCRGFADLGIRFQRIFS
jgi:hypothetical protein